MVKNFKKIFFLGLLWCKVLTPGTTVSLFSFQENDSSFVLFFLYIYRSINTINSFSCIASNDLVSASMQSFSLEMKKKEYKLVISLLQIQKSVSDPILETGPLRRFVCFKTEFLRCNNHTNNFQHNSKNSKVFVDVPYLVCSIVHTNRKEIHRVD